MKSRTPFAALAVILAIASIAQASRPVELRDGLLTVNGKPFYPLGTWAGAATPQELLELGMNVDFQGMGGSPAKLKERVDRFARHGILAIPYPGYSLTKQDLEAYVKPLADSPNLLAWYIGDDVTAETLPALLATADIVHANDQMHPVVADYWDLAKVNPQARPQFRPALDIMCQYTYPFPRSLLGILPDGRLGVLRSSIEQYLQFFDRQRLNYGDPLWTWIQAFMLHDTGRDLKLGKEGPAPIPEPDQVRLLTYVAVNRGVRGILFFGLRYFHPVLENKAEIALLCREIRLAEPYLAGGRLALDIPVSDTTLRASSFTRPEGTVVALVALGPNYNHWVDEGVYENVSFTVRCKGKRPRALLLAIPKPAECSIQSVGAGQFRVIVPRLELGGFVLITSNQNEIDRVQRQAARYAAEVAPLAVVGAAAQLRKVNGAYWSLGSDLPGGAAPLDEARKRLEEAYRALGNNQPGTAVAGTRHVLCLCRQAIDRTMRMAHSRRPLLTQVEAINLETFYSLHHIPALLLPIPDEKGYRFLRQFSLVGPFPLELERGSDDIIPAGFDRAYPPESGADYAASYDGVEGPVRWRPARTWLDARLNLEQYLTPSENVVAYAAALITAPRDMETILGLGSNDGAKVWVNGSLLYAQHKGHPAKPNQDLIPASLRAGKNTVLVKIENWGGRWELYLSVRDPENVLTFAAP